MSYLLSKMSAFSGASGSPRGGGTRCTTASRMSRVPMPSRALARMQSSPGRPITSSISLRTSSGSAAGRSILLITGTIARSFSSAWYTLARVCASMPWAASTTRMAPSHAASERDTS